MKKNENKLKEIKDEDEYYRMKRKYEKEKRLTIVQTNRSKLAQLELYSPPQMKGSRLSDDLQSRFNKTTEKSNYHETTVKEAQIEKENLIEEDKEIEKQLATHYFKHMKAIAKKMKLNCEKIDKVAEYNLK